jgi:hypothetical protein
MNWVIMLVAGGVALKVHTTWADAGVRRDHQYLSHAAVVLVLAGFLAFWSPIVLSILGAPIGPDQFFAMWAFLWLAMLCFGGVVLTLLRVLGPVKGAGVHSLFLLVNFIASPAMAPAEIAYAPFRVGIALPFQK